MNVELIDYMGSDLSVIDAARVSFDKKSEWDTIKDNDGTTKHVLNNKDARLIKYLAEHNHWTPFSHPQVTLRVTIPIYVARQLAKHQVGGTVNEVSRRYVKYTPKIDIPTRWRKAADNVKQGSSDEEVKAIKRGTYYTQDAATYVVTTAVSTYNNMLEAGVAPELARMILPQNMMTTFVWTGSLLGYIQMLKLRLDSHSQKEIRDLAQMIADVIRPLFPVSYAALMGEDDGT